MSTFIFVLELIGTIAFAVSGSFVGIRKNLDLFGVLITGLATAVGGGLLRDLFLGTFPPVMFQKPVYAITALVSCLIVCIPQIRTFIDGNNLLLLFSDAAGLGIFTATSTMRSLSLYGDNIFLAVFVGTLTAVGGGLLRDTMASETPYIFTKHIYATACIAGGILFCLLLPLIGYSADMLLTSAFIVAVRMFAIHYRWNLPKPAEQTKKTESRKHRLSI